MGIHGHKHIKAPLNEIGGTAWLADVMNKEDHTVSCIHGEMAQSERLSSDVRKWESCYRHSTTDLREMAKCGKIDSRCEISGIRRETPRAKAKSIICVTKEFVTLL